MFFVSGVNMSCKQELVIADPSLVENDHVTWILASHWSASHNRGFWLAEVLRARQAQRTGIIIITGERHAAGSATAAAEFYAALVSCRLLHAGCRELQETSRLCVVAHQPCQHLPLYLLKVKISTILSSSNIYKLKLDNAKISQLLILMDEKVSLHWHYLWEL